MKYIVKINKEGRKVIQGIYIPQGYSCDCKECKFVIEVLKETSDEEIKELIEKLRTL